MSHFIFAVFGAAGDIFPSIAVAQALQDRGHRTTVLAPASAALFARTAGLATLSIGDGREMRVIGDEELYTTRFDGFSSWRRLATRYIYPAMREGYARARKRVEDMAPDAMVVHPLAPFGSLIAAELDVPCASLHTYPQLAPGQHGSGVVNFGGELATLIRTIERERGLTRSANPFLDRGWCEVNLSVHDPALAQRTQLAEMDIGELCGFPAWDGIAMAAEDQQAATRAIETDRPLLLATLGSLISHTQRNTLWTRLAGVTRELGWSALLIGVPPALRAPLSEHPHVTCAGFVPLSSVAPHADVLVHHGGAGTMYAAIRAGLVSAAIPHAFDQTFNGRLIEQAGIGRSLAADDDLVAALRSIHDDDGMRETVRALSTTVVAPASATTHLAQRLTTLATSP